MGVNNVLYDRPDLDQQISRLAALYVTGTLPNAGASAAYEGRLQIHNAVGTCWAEVINGELPGGGAVYVDQATQEVVVAWPAYAQLDNLTNPNLETGDMTGWDVETIGGSGTLVASDVYPEGGVGYSAYWAGGRGMGSEGGIECVAINQTRSKVYPGQMVSGTIDIGYNFAGGTPKGSRGQTWLIWYDKNDQKLGETKGDLIATRKYNHRWTPSHALGVGPDNVDHVRLAAWLTATGAGHSWFDNARWDAKTIVGTDQTTPICITVRVHDAAGRVADWSGCVLFNPVPADLTWRYKLIPYASPFPAGVPAEATVDYDDSTWLESAAPYGNLSTNAIAGAHAHAHDPRLPATVGTTIPKDTGVWIRRHIHLDSVPSGGLNVVAYIDNYLRIYANGAAAFSVNNKYDGPGDGNIPASALQVGDNLIAAWCMDDAGPGGDNDASYFGFLLDLA